MLFDYKQNGPACFVCGAVALFLVGFLIMAGVIFARRVFKG